MHLFCKQAEFTLHFLFCLCQKQLSPGLISSGSPHLHEPLLEPVRGSNVVFSVRYYTCKLCCIGGFIPPSELCMESNPSKLKPAWAAVKVEESSVKNTGREVLMRKPSSS